MTFSEISDTQLLPYPKRSSLFDVGFFAVGSNFELKDESSRLLTNSILNVNPPVLSIDRDSEFDPIIFHFSFIDDSDSEASNYVYSKYIASYKDGAQDGKTGAVDVAINARNHNGLITEQYLLRNVNFVTIRTSPLDYASTDTHLQTANISFLPQQIVGNNVENVPGIKELMETLYMFVRSVEIRFEDRTQESKKPSFVTKYVICAARFVDVKYGKDIIQFAI